MAVLPGGWPNHGDQGPLRTGSELRQATGANRRGYLDSLYGKSDCVREAVVPTLIVQHIHIQWTKAARGGRLAERRSLLPQAITLPDIPHQTDKAARYVVHRIDFYDLNEFNSPCRQQVLMPLQGSEYRVPNCTVDPTAAKMHFSWCHGAPARTPNRSFPISSSTLTRIQYNPRFSAIDDGSWNYTHEIVSAIIALPTAELFLTTAVGVQYADLQHLW